MKQKLFSWGGGLRSDESAATYFVDGKAFSFGSAVLPGSRGSRAAFIQQKVLSWGPTYEIVRDGQVAAVVKKELFTFIHHRFTVDVPGPDDLEAEGSFTDHEYVFRRGDRVVATVSMQWFSWVDTYGVDVDADEDPVLILASAVVIDQACHPDDGKRH